MSAAVLKARTAHIFHVGDARVFRLTGEDLESLTQDHRVILAGESYLGRALGLAPDVPIDYRTVALADGDIFVLCTDGVHEHLATREIARLVRSHCADLDQAARRIVNAAIAHGSQDDVTVQLVRIESLPAPDAATLGDVVEALPPAPILEPPVEFDGYRVLRQIHANSRSHIYLASDLLSGQRIALKVPGVDLRTEPALLRQFMMEEWIARRVNSPHVLKAVDSDRRRNFLYVVTEHVEGATLRQWMYDNPAPDLDRVRDILDQVVKGARAMHRKQMVHGDLRPENILIDRQGVVRIIDFGATRVAGVVEAAGPSDGSAMLGTLQYTAPECLAGEPATWRADLFSIGVIAYEMLTGRLPYGASAARVRRRSEITALRYQMASRRDRILPTWIDGALRTAVHPDARRRYEALSDFITDLRTPNPRFRPTGFVPLVERDPVRFWQGVSVVLALTLLAMVLNSAR